MANLRELRISFIWMEAFPLDKIAASLLGDSQRYLREYGNATAGTGSWSLPWTSIEGHRFWLFYLENKIKDTLSWRHLMPLRSLPFVKVDKAPGLQLAMEGFGYPHGAAMLVTAYLKQDLPVFDMVDRAIKVWKGKHRATWLETGITYNQSLEQLAEQGLKFLWTSLEAEPENLVTPLYWPFKVATVINAHGFQVEKPEEPRTGGEIHRALEGLCTLDPSYKHKKLPSLEEHCLPLRLHSPDMHLLYYRERSRALWFPYYFEQWCDEYRSHDKSIQKLGCYHRNLTLAALQVESLIALIMRLNELLKREQKIPSPLKELARYAGGIIGRLLGGKKTYRTMSVKRRLEDKRIFKAWRLVREATKIT